MQVCKTWLCCVTYFLVYLHFIMSHSRLVKKIKLVFTACCMCVCVWYDAACTSGYNVYVTSHPYFLIVRVTCPVCYHLICLHYKGLGLDRFFALTFSSKKNMKFWAWNISLYRSGSFKLAARKLANYNSDMVGDEEVKWDKGDIEREDIYTFYCGKGNGNCHLYKVLNKCVLHYENTHRVCKW